MSNLAKCRSCGADIYWMKLHKREFDKIQLKMVSFEVPDAKANPIDVQPNPKGNLVIDRDGGRYGDEIKEVGAKANSAKSADIVARFVIDRIGSGIAESGR